MRTAPKRVQTIPEPKITEKDLGVIKAINKVGGGGIDATMPTGFGFVPLSSESFANSVYSRDGQYQDSYLFTLMLTLKNWQFKKFEYSGFDDDFPIGELERLLFLYGSVMLFKVNEKVFATSWIPKSYDPYFYPKTAVGIFPSGERTNVLEVGKDCVIIWDDESQITSAKSYWSPLNRVWTWMVQIARAYSNILRNQTIGKQFVKLPVDTDPAIQLGLEEAMRGDSLTLKVDDGARLSVGKVGMTEAKELGMTDRTATYWDDYYNGYNELKAFFGINANANANKRERQINAEIDVNNVITDAMWQTKFDSRVRGIDRANSVLDLKLSVKAWAPDLGKDSVENEIKERDDSVEKE